MPDQKVEEFFVTEEIKYFIYIFILEKESVEKKYIDWDSICPSELHCFDWSGISIM